MKNAARNAGARLAVLWLVLGSAGVQGAEVTLLHVDAGAVRTLEPAGDDPEAVRIEVFANGKSHRLDLAPNRGLDALATRGGGRARAYAGDVGDLAGSWAAVTRIDGRWHGMWYDGGEYYGVDTAGALAGASAAAAALEPDQPVVFRLRDVIFAASLDGDTRVAALTGEELASQWQAAKPPQQSVRRLAVAAAADAGFVRTFGAGADAHVLALLNVVDGIFASQLGLSVSAASVSLFADDSGPFSATTSADTLLDEVGAWRIRSLDHRHTGVTHLFTGRTLSGRIVGLAFVGSLCSRRFATSLSQAAGGTSLSALIAAHEIGHVLGAPHDGDAQGACAATAGDFLMAPRLTGSQQFSACSVAQIAPRIAAASCLDPAQPLGGLPADPGRPALAGGSGALSAWHLAMLGLLMAMRSWPGQPLARTARTQTRANQSAR